MTQFLKVALTKEAVLDTNGVALDVTMAKAERKLTIKPPLYVVQAYLPPFPNHTQSVEMRVFWDFTPDKPWQWALANAMRNAAEAI